MSEAGEAGDGLRTARLLSGTVQIALSGRWVCRAAEKIGGCNNAFFHNFLWKYLLQLLAEGVVAITLHFLLLWTSVDSGVTQWTIFRKGHGDGKYVETCCIMKLLITVITD